MLNTFRIIAFLEGVSYLLLMAGSYIKHFQDDPQYVKLFGMPHGLLFVAYVALAFLLRSTYKWNSKTFAIILIASLLPFGTFYIEKKYLKQLA